MKNFPSFGGVKADSLAILDTADVYTVYQKTNVDVTFNPSLSIYHGKRIIAYSETHGWKKGQLMGHIQVGMAEFKLGKIDRAIGLLKQGLELYGKGPVDSVQIHAYNLLGNLYRVTGRHVEAQKSHYKALRMCQDLPDDKEFMSAYNGLGHVFLVRANYMLAESYYMKGMKVAQRLGDLQSLATVSVNMGNMFLMQDSTLKAIERFENALDYWGKDGFTYGKVWAEYKLGNAYRLREEYRLALQHLRIAQQGAQEIHFNRGMAAVDIALGQCYREMGLISKGERLLKSGLAIAEEAKMIELLPVAYDDLYHLYHKSNNYEKAFEYLHRLKVLNDSLYTKEKEGVIRKLENTYQLEQKEEENKDLKQENKEQESVIFWQKVLGYIVVFSLLIFCVFALVLYLENKRKRIANMELSSTNIDLQEKQQLLLEQKQHLQEVSRELQIKKEDLEDSLSYASTIQSALLPLERDIEGCFSEHFILYKPMQYVSGDFYWMHTEEIDGEHLDFFVVADCTGHGVSGAFMSVLGNSILRESVIQKKLKDPSDILMKVGEVLEEHLKPTETKSFDSMEMGICVINRQKGVLRFASSGIPLIYFRGNTMCKLRGDKTKFDLLKKNKGKYVVHEIDLSTDLTFYMYSDGYQDQFGGRRGKKLLSRRFRKVIEKIHHLPMQRQFQELDRLHLQWKGDEDQTDDILVFGACCNVYSLEHNSQKTSTYQALEEMPSKI
ncbi:SpoIIE family protein phosphatase [Algivirga pacifica]